MISSCHINAEAKPRHLFPKIEKLILWQCSIAMTSFLLCQENDAEKMMLSSVRWIMVKESDRRSV